MCAARVRVIQSHRDPLPAHWYERCVESVSRWSNGHGFEHVWLGDELFDGLDPVLTERFSEQPVVASDLARLIVLEQALKDGCDRAVWVDADVLVLDPALRLPAAGALFGREVWVQRDDEGRLKVYPKIHNAFMAFSRDDPVLPFYRFAAERILQRYQGRPVPQLVGPKLLSVLHNAIGFDVLEAAAVLSPAVIQDLLHGGGAALERFREASPAVPAAVNVCGSSVARGELSDADVACLIDRLVAAPGILGR